MRFILRCEDKTGRACTVRALYSAPGDARAESVEVLRATYVGGTEPVPQGLVDLERLTEIAREAYRSVADMAEGRAETDWDG
jgi:hypothetical protein